MVVIDTGVIVQFSSVVKLPRLFSEAPSYGRRFLSYLVFLIHLFIYAGDIYSLCEAIYTTIQSVKSVLT